ncbi:40S ribosomal protein S29-like [Pteropus alecto]|uniref:40S ribosomal protein S29-like n=1 Tax=Pteropus alecto TaxID=9402 RepID=UPI000D538011|nr:40S ribosomal protein S29-like [Pteropus alecto]
MEKQDYNRVKYRCLYASKLKVGHQQQSCSQLRKFGRGSHSCLICSNQHGLICKCCLSMCHPWFGQYAKDISFMKLD